jgi:hypothetical protein
VAAGDALRAFDVCVRDRQWINVEHRCAVCASSRTHL